MNKLEKLEEQYKKLGEEIQALKKENDFVPGWYMYWDNYNNPTYYIEKIDYIENLHKIQEAWDRCELVTKEVFDKFFS